MIEKNKFWMLALVVPLFGCESIPEKFVGPNSRDAYSMSCGGDPTDCYKKASQLCPSGYQIINSTSSSQLVTNTYTKQSISIPRTNVAIECK